MRKSPHTTGQPSSVHPRPRDDGRIIIDLASGPPARDYNYAKKSDPRLDTRLNLLMAKATILTILALTTSLGCWAIVLIWQAILSTM